MKKKLLLSLVALILTTLPATAQSTTGTIAPKPGYTCDFENAEKPDFTDEIITINGKRWRFHNARITQSTINGIPQGKRAAELLAGAPNGEPATLELLDPIHGGAVALCFGHSGMDRTINRSSEAWTIELSSDDGKTWATQPLRFDHIDVASMQSFESPFYGEPFRFRIRYTSNETQGKNWRVLVDNIFVVEGEWSDIPWYIQPGRIYDGFETSQDSLAFTPIMSGMSFYFGDPSNTFTDTYVQTQVDDQSPEKFYTMPIDVLFKAKGLTEGKHHYNIQFMQRDDDQPWVGPLATDFDFYVRPVSGTIKGISALRKAEVGKFYDLVPNSSDSIFINWTFKTRAQKWLFDSKAGILVDDPNYIDYSAEVSPMDQVVKKMRGQLLLMDNNLVFRLDGKPEIEDVEGSNFHFRNYICDDVSIITNEYEQYAGFPLALTGVRLVEPLGNVDGYPNGRIEIEDLKGNRLYLQNIYPGDFQKTQFDTGTEHYNIFGMVGKTYIDGIPCFFPLNVQGNNKPSSINDTVDNTTEPFTVTHQSGQTTLLSSKPCTVTINNMNGYHIGTFDLTADTPRSTTLEHGLFIATAHYADGTHHTVRFIN